MQWSITIVEGEPSARFVPDVYTPPDQTAPDGLRAQTGDVVSWNNQTADEHHPWIAGDDFKPAGPQLCDVIRPWASSMPGYVVPDSLAAGSVIRYCCYLHPEEQGTIEVVA